MITKVVWDVSGATHEVDWYWQQEPSIPSVAHSTIPGEWYPEIETVDGETPDLSDEQLAVVQEACAQDYSLDQFLSERRGSMA